jgi:hypothetical protein
MFNFNKMNFNISLFINFYIMLTKKIYYRPIIVVCIMGIILSSCEKFLEEKPKNTVSEENYYTTEEDAISAVNSIYAYLNVTSAPPFSFGVYHSDFWLAAGLAADELQNDQPDAPQYAQLATFTYEPRNASLDIIWQEHYKAITLANIAIERIPKINMDTVLRQRLVNESKFLRALLYFNLVRMFGNIPLLLHETEPLYPSQAPVSAIYNQIIQDLTDAELLPSQYEPGDGRGRATKWAAKGLLAKVYLTQKDFVKCAAKALEVINSNQFALWEDYASVFKLSSRNGKEAIFSVSFGDAGGAISFWEVGQFNVRLLPRQLSEIGVVNSQGWQSPVQQLYDSFDPDDRRRSVTFITEAKKTDGTIITFKPYIQKYWDSVAEPTGNGSANDFPVLRYADILLMYAEASMENGDATNAFKYINTVRRRARFDGTIYRNTLPDYSGLSLEQFRTAVLNERRMEFICEGQRWFDLVRTNTLQALVPIAKLNVVPALKHNLFPIPQREIEVNPNLKQNEGY